MPKAPNSTIVPEPKGRRARKVLAKATFCAMAALLNRKVSSPIGSLSWAKKAWDEEGASGFLADLGDAGVKDLGLPCSGFGD